jgi:predicted aminopeptidase
MQEFREAYAQLRASWDGYAGYDAWVAGANNASLGAQAAYDDLVPAFEALFVRQAQDWRRFYDAVKQLSRQPKAQRAQALQIILMEQAND